MEPESELQQKALLLGLKQLKGFGLFGWSLEMKIDLKLAFLLLAVISASLFMIIESGEYYSTFYQLPIPSITPMADILRSVLFTSFK